MSKLHLRETWKDEHSHAWNITQYKMNGCPKAPCMAEGCLIYEGEGDNRKRVIYCDYFKAGDKIQHYLRWDRPSGIETLIGEPKCDEHGIGWHTEEGSYWWVYNMEKVEEVRE